MPNLLAAMALKPKRMIHCGTPSYGKTVRLPLEDLQGCRVFCRGAGGTAFKDAAGCGNEKPD